MPAPGDIEVLIRTTEDWHPSLDESGRGDRAGAFVKLQFLSLPPFPPIGGWRVRAVGGDDTCMERDFDAHERADAVALFERLRDGPPITFSALRSLGLQRA